MLITRRNTIAGLAAIGLSACDPIPADDDPPPDFDALTDQYRDIEGRIFPGARTREDDLPDIGGYWDGAARLAYFEDGVTFSGGIAARMSIVADFLLGEIKAFDDTGLRGVVTDDGDIWPGAIRLRSTPFTGNTFGTVTRGTLFISGTEAQFRGRMRGGFWGDGGRYAFGSVGMAGPDLSPRLSGTFALRRRGVT